MSRKSSNRRSVSVNDHLNSANNLLQGKGELPKSRIEYNQLKKEACSGGEGTDSCIMFLNNKKKLLKELRKKHNEPEPSVFRWFSFSPKGGKKLSIRKKANKRKTKKGNRK
jgi:hypothetical protein